MTHPAAAAMREETVAGTGAQIFIRSWRPAGAAKAIVAVCHGVNSHSGYYLWAGEQLAASGFAVYALDLRGRGRSSGERFYIEEFSEYLHDLLNDYGREQVLADIVGWIEARLAGATAGR